MPKPTNASSEPPAAAADDDDDAYAARRGDIARLLDVLNMELDRHDAAAKATPGDWGLADNLGKVRTDLINTVAFISNMEPGDVEGFLNDAE